jgi:hypothetical protein
VSRTFFEFSWEVLFVASCLAQHECHEIYAKPQSLRQLLTTAVGYFTGSLGFTS